MDKDCKQTIDHFIIDTIEYIRKKRKKRANEPTITHQLFSKNNSVNVEKHVIEKIITFLTTYGMSLENKPNGNRNSLRVKDQSKFASGE